MKKKFFTALIIFFTCSAQIFANNLPVINADGAILIEPKTNTIIYAKNMDKTFYPASTTKILTCLALINDLDPNAIATKTTDSVNSVPSDSSHIGLSVGDKYSVIDGIHGILMSSDNFISHDLALVDKGSISSFANHMNSLARSFGASHSNFLNPHGYHEQEHYTTPYDLSQIARHVFSNDELTKIAGTPTYDFKVINSGKTLSLKHTSLLLDSNSIYYNPNVVASKTGFHTPAGRTLVAKAVYDDIELIGIIMRTESPNQFTDMNSLFDYGSKYFSHSTDDNNIDVVVNKTYSNWSEGIVNNALDNGWISNTTRNYTASISTREFINILKNAIPESYHETLNSISPNSSSSIFKENLRATKGDIASTCYKLLSKLNLYSSIGNNDTSSLSNSIDFCTTLGLMTTDNDGNFNPNNFISYEEALSVISKVNLILNRYDSYALPY